MRQVSQFSILTCAKAIALIVSSLSALCFKCSSLANNEYMTTHQKQEKLLLPGQIKKRISKNSGNGNYIGVTVATIALNALQCLHVAFARMNCALSKCLFVCFVLLHLKSV